MIFVVNSFLIDPNSFSEDGWMSWKRKGQNKPVELIFKFDDIRKFTKVNIYTANLLHLHTQVFNKAVVSFSIGGEYYTQEPVTYVYMADTILKEPRNVSIRLNGHVAKFVKLELYFSNVWMSISEVYFVSSPARGRYEIERAPAKKIVESSTESILIEQISNDEVDAFTEDTTKTQGEINCRDLKSVLIFQRSQETTVNDHFYQLIKNFLDNKHYEILPRIFPIFSWL